MACQSLDAAVGDRNHGSDWLRRVNVLAWCGWLPGKGV
jgi:hypothetical protein